MTISCVLQVGLLKLTRKGLIDVDVRDWLVREDKLHCSIKTCMWFVLFGVLICGGYGIWSHTNVVNFSITVQLSCFPCLINRVQHIHTDVSKTCPQYERDMYVFRGGGVLHTENGEACGGMCRDSDEWPLGGVDWESGGAL